MSLDLRHTQRVATVQSLFAWQFDSQQELTAQAGQIIEFLPQIDDLIQTLAPAWPISQMSKLDLAILRVAVFELEKTEVPKKVVIDEAVEIAKEFGSDTTPKFINGVLAAVLRKYEQNHEQTQSSPNQGHSA